MALVLVAEDDSSFRALLRDVLEDDGHRVVEVTNGADALEQIERRKFDVVISDERMPRVDGLQLVAKLQSGSSAPPVILLTAFGTIPRAVDAMRAGAFDYLTKPLPAPAALLEVVSRALRRDSGDGGIVTADERMTEALDLVDRVAVRDVPVLVTGESGTGKELVARRLHTKSPRAAKAFVAVNCAALPESLAESEFFGHERGAFTGADRARQGRFEEADGGTLFLDEIGDLSLPLQAKLLRVLEEHVIRRVGGSRDISVDARLVAATNRDLAAAVETGAFRRDLYFRLNVIHVVLPPLRERRGDVEQLALHFVRTLASRHGIDPPEIDRDAIAALDAYQWPGNVRELRNVLERAVVVRGSEPVRARDLAFETSRPLLTLSAERDSAERTAVMDALRRAGGNRDDAAKLLGVSVRTLYYRLRKLGVQ